MNILGNKVKTPTTKTKLNKKNNKITMTIFNNSKKHSKTTKIKLVYQKFSPIHLKNLLTNLNILIQPSVINTTIKTIFSKFHKRNSRKNKI